MLHPLARITSAYRFNLGWDALTGGLLTRMFPQGCSPVSESWLYRPLVLQCYLNYCDMSSSLSACDHDWSCMSCHALRCSIPQCPNVRQPPLSRGLLPSYQVLSMLCLRWQLLGVYPWHFGTWVIPFILVRLVKAFITVTYGRTYWRPIFYLWNCYHFPALDEFQTLGSTSIICQL